MAFNRFAPPPWTPNCVSSKAPVGHKASIEPYSFSKPWQEAKEILMKTLEEMPRFKLVENDGEYLRYIDRTKIMRFIDDVEFQFDPGAGLIHIRSASRLGIGDHGVNRERMEEIRGKLKGKI